MAMVTIVSLRFAFLSRAISLLLLLLSGISFTIGDTSDLEVASGTLSSPFLLSPKKLSLFAKALHKVVLAQCTNMDHSDLDTFQAYLIRQIAKMEDGKMGHPLHFDSVYQALTGCANFLSPSPSPPRAPAMMAELDTGDIGNSYNEKISYKSSTDQLTSTTVTLGEIRKNSGIGSEKSEREIPPTAIHSHPDFKSSPPTTRHPKDVKIIANPSPRPSTVIDKMVHNVTDITMNFISGLFSAVFGRRKRDLTSLEREDNPDDVNPTPSYSRSQIVLVNININKTDMASDQPDMDTNYNEIWNSVSGQDTKMSAYYSHAILLLKSFIAVAVDGCSKTFPIDEIYLSQICELMANQVMVGLAEAGSQGMGVTVNEKLENDLELCVKNISWRTQVE